MKQSQLGEETKLVGNSVHGALGESEVPYKLGVSLPSFAKKEQDGSSELCSLYGHGLSQSLPV